MATYRINGVKYNPANWAMLEKAERAACARFAAARERELNTIETNEHPCTGGPFDGAVIELHSMASAPIHVGAWVGHYQAANTVTGCAAEWVGTDGGQAVNTHGTSAQAKAAPEVTGQGFDQLRDLLADLAEDPAEREKTISMRNVSITWPVGAADDFGDLITGEVPTHCNQSMEFVRATGRGKDKKRVYIFTTHPGHGTGFMDDFGKLTKAPATRTHGANFPRAIEQITHAIGRTRYTINATPEAAANLRARILKAKKWFADKCLTAAKPTAAPVPTPAEAVAALVADAVAAVAIDAAQTTARADELSQVATVADEVACMAEACADAMADGVACMPRAEHSGQPPSHTTTRAGFATPGSGQPAGTHADSQPPAPRAAVGNGSPRWQAYAGDISASLAISAFNGVSFSPERRGASAQNDYAQSMASDYEKLHAQAVKGGTLHLLPEVFARYRARQAGAYRAYLASSSRCVSSFIAGPANFPAARMNKRADIAHKRLTEYLDGGAMAMQAACRTLRPDLRAIMSGDVDAIDRLTVKIEAAERAQASMKAANKAIRTHAKAGEPHQVAALMDLGFSEAQAVDLLHPRWGNSLGFASFSLTNNNANIRRMRERLEQISKAQATEVKAHECANGVTLEDDAPANRIRLYFPGKPSEAIRDELKSSGFRWAPSVGAWQAYRNSGTLATAKRLAGEPLPTASEAPEVAEVAEAQQIEANQPATNEPAKPNSEGDRIRAAADKMRARFPAIAEKYEVMALSQDLKDEREKRNASHAAHGLPLVPHAHQEPIDTGNPTCKGKSGKWAAWLRMTWDNLHQLAFRTTTGEIVYSTYDTGSARMAALQRLARAADAPAKQQRRQYDGFFVRVSKTQAETLWNAGEPVAMLAYKRDTVKTNTACAESQEFATFQEKAQAGESCLRYGEKLYFYAPQAASTTADTGHAMATDARLQHLAAFDPSGVDVWQCSTREVQAMAEADFVALVQHLENVNHHTAALCAKCLRAGCDDLADACTRLENAHVQAGQLTPALALARFTIGRLLRGESVNMAEAGAGSGLDACEVSEAVALVGNAYPNEKAAATPHTPPPSAADGQATPPVCAAGAPDYTHPVETLAGDYTYPVETLQQSSSVDATTPSQPRHPRNIVPRGGLHIVEDAFEAWTFHHEKSDRFGFVMYLGKQSKPYAYYGYATEAKRDAGFERHAQQARDILASKAKRKAEDRAKLDAGHALQVGDVVRSSWGYDQTNVDHYQIIKVIGKRTVEVRALAVHEESTGDMSGRVAPVWGEFVGEVMRRQVDKHGNVNMLSASYGRASKIEPVAVVHGVRCYAATHYSSYA